MEEPVLLNEERSPGSVCLTWWSKLQHRPSARARLRRCGSILELLIEPETHALRRRLLELKPNASADKVAVIAGVIIAIEKHQDRPFGFSIGQKSAETSAIEVRFQRLLRLEWNEYEELLSQFRRLLPLVRNQANIESVSEAIWYWGDATKKRLAVEYYEARPPK